MLSSLKYFNDGGACFKCRCILDCIQQSFEHVNYLCLLPCADKREMVCSSGGPGENKSQGDGGGDRVDGMNAPDINVEREPNIYATQTVHSKSDFLVAYSTPEGRLCFIFFFALLLQSMLDFEDKAYSLL